MFKFLRPIIFMLISFNTESSVKNDLEQFFQDRGYSANVTSGGAYRDQKGSYFTGGSIMARSKASNTELLSLQMPNFKSGCGGIDLFTGGLSFISDEAFMQMARNIGSNALGYGFSLALQTVTPQIKSTLDRLMAISQDVNNMNINSCSMGAAVLGGVWPKTDASSQLLCHAMGTSQNTFTDYAQARQGCGAGGRRDAVNNQKKDRPEFKDMLGDEFNLVWKALKKNPLFAGDNELAELFMSLSGTIITKKMGAGANSYLLPQHISFLADNDALLNALIKGGVAEVYHCDTDVEDGCLNPVKQRVTILEADALLEKVNAFIHSLVGKLKNDRASTPAEMGFVNATNIPIFKILAVQTAFKTDNNPLQSPELAEVIAYDILLKYLSRALDIVSDSLRHIQGVQLNDFDIKPFAKNLHFAKTLIYQRRQGLFQQLNANLAIMERTQQIERQLHQLFAEEYE